MSIPTLRTATTEIPKSNHFSLFTGRIDDIRSYRLDLPVGDYNTAKLSHKLQQNINPLQQNNEQILDINQLEQNNEQILDINQLEQNNEQIQIRNNIQLHPRFTED